LEVLALVVRYLTTPLVAYGTMVACIPWPEMNSN